MHWFNAVWTFYLQWTSYSTDLVQPLAQPPLLLPHHPHRPPSMQESAASPPCNNSPTSRDCWFGEYNISTDYEKITPPGEIRDISLFLTDGTWFFHDGYQKDAALLNGTYPGPIIEGNWGDTFRITVHNELTNYNGTSIHWHGVRQLHTNWADGVSGVTQCPIPPGGSMTYEWRALQYGTSWYHSHFSLQYPDGIAGPLVIHGPTSANYDVDLGPLMITDWYHKSAFSIFHNEIMHGPPARSDWKLLNGRWGASKCVAGDLTCDPDMIEFYEATFEKGKKYKMRIINTSASPHYTFWIDGHNFTVVATDFVPIKPYPSHVLNVAIGQRYDIIIEANADTSQGTDFWINMRDCQLNSEEDTPYTGIIRYDPQSTATPSFSYLDPGSFGCRDEPTKSLTPVVPRTVPNVGSLDDLTSLEVSNYPVATYPPPEDPDLTSDIHVWEVANSSLYLDWEIPSLTLVRAQDSFPDTYAPLIINGTDEHWVYFIIKGNFTGQPNLHRNPIPVAHPIHLHGHDFVILAQSTESFNESAFDPTSLPYDNPTRRDVAMLPVGGYLIIAFPTDNPGVWLMHCHIAWHASAGLALQFVEREAEIPALIPSWVSVDYADQCVAWKGFYSSSPAKQEDSGI